MIIGWCCSIAPRLSRMQDQKLLTLRWCSFLGGSSNIVSSSFAHNGRQYYDYGWMPLHSPVIIQDASSEIIDAPLTLISMMAQGACCLPFWLVWRPILLLWIDATMQSYDYWMGKTINCWHSVDAHLWAHLRDIVTVIGCSTIVQKMHTGFIGSLYTVSMYFHLNPRSLTHLSFWATSAHVICMMNDVVP